MTLPLWREPGAAHPYKERNPGGNRPKWPLAWADDGAMGNLSETELLLIALGTGMMFYVMLKAIGQGAVAVASEQIAERREEEAQRRAEDAAAEAAGRAAALEPLVVNSDGSIAEPILALVEERS
jgi:hypothetical protein